MTNVERKIRLIPTIHPAAFLRGGAGNKGASGVHAIDLQAISFSYDIRKIANLAAGKLAPFKVDIATAEHNPRRAATLLRGIVKDIRRVGFYALDLETV